MVDSILTNQAPVVQRPSENRSITSPAVTDASSVPEVELADVAIDVSPRTMDTDPQSSFSERGSPDLRPDISNMLDSGIELRPPLENFQPIEITSEKALENRVADLEIKTPNQIDESDTEVSLRNSSIEAFRTTEQTIQQTVDISA